MPQTIASTASTPVTPLPKRTVAPQPFRHRMTIAEYRKQAATGIYDTKRTILLDGEVFEMPLPNPLHDVALGKCDDLLRVVFSNGYHIRGQMSFDVGTRNDPGPDLAVVKGVRADYLKSAPTQAALIVEVADSSLTMDTTTKAELYATAKVPEYWVIDLENRRLLIFRDPVSLPSGLGATAFRTHTTHDPHETVSPLSAPNVTILVADLLP